MIEIIIIFSLIAGLATYIIASSKEGSFLNVFTPWILLSFPANYILELVHIYFYGGSGSLYAYFYCYLTYTLSFIVLVVVYFNFPNIKVKLPFKQVSIGGYLPYLFLFLSFFLYLPILIEFSEFILSPRELYMMTRTGYGLNFFLSSTLMYIAFILFLFKRAFFKTEKFFIFIVCTILAILHGSKGQILTLLLILLFYQAYINGFRVKFVKFALYTMIFTLIVILLFSLTLFGVDDIFLIEAISSYSDYTRNAMMVIDSDMSPLFGRLTLEDTVYSRIPRSIYPDKPKDFGNFYLAKEFYPEWFYLDTGSPSFGVGVQFADFGVFSIFYHLLWSVLLGILLKSFVTRLRTYKNPSDFIMVLFLSGITLIPLGAGYLLPEHFFIAFGLAKLLRLNFFTSKHRISGSELR